MLNRQTVHPGEILRKDILPDLDTTADKFAKKIGVNTDYFNEVVNAEAPITKELAEKLSNEFGNSAEFWLNLQANYDADQPNFN